MQWNESHPFFGSWFQTSYLHLKHSVPLSYIVPPVSRTMNWRSDPSVCVCVGVCVILSGEVRGAGLPFRSTWKFNRFFLLCRFLVIFGSYLRVQVFISANGNNQSAYIVCLKGAVNSHSVKPVHHHSLLIHVICSYKSKTAWIKQRKGHMGPWKSMLRAVNGTTLDFSLPDWSLQLILFSYISTWKAKRWTSTMFFPMNPRWKASL